MTHSAATLDATPRQPGAVPVRRRPLRTRRLPAVGPTAVSLVLHAAALLVLLIITVAPPPETGVGPAISMSFLPDLSDPIQDEETPETAPPLEELEPIDVPELPEVHIVEEVLPPETLEALDPLDTPEHRFELPLAIATRRTRPEPQPKAPVVQPPIRPTPIRVVSRPPVRPLPARPVARPRATTGGRLRPLSTPIHYPEAARRSGIQGVTRVEMIVGAGGRILSVRLASSSGHAVLDQAALSSARQWRFAAPGAPRRVIQPFRFSMR